MIRTSVCLRRTVVQDSTRCITRLRARKLSAFDAPFPWEPLIKVLAPDYYHSPAWMWQHRENWNDVTWRRWSPVLLRSRPFNDVGAVWDSACPAQRCRRKAWYQPPPYEPVTCLQHQLGCMQGHDFIRIAFARTFWDYPGRGYMHITSHKLIQLANHIQPYPVHHRAYLMRISECRRQRSLLLTRPSIWITTSLYDIMRNLSISCFESPFF